MKRSTKKSSWNKSILIGLLVFMAFISVTTTPFLLNKVVNKTTKIHDSSVLGNYFLGVNKPVRILLLFENNAEARFGGGFVGTVGYVTVENGKIKPGPVRSVYYYDYKANDPEYYTENILNPDGQTEKRSFSLRNVVDEISWEQSARRASRIFEQESGLESDVVIGITPEVLKSLLKKTGPINVSDYNLVVNHENLLSTIQLEVESGQDKAERKDPKSVLTSLANSLIQKISNQNVKTLTGYYDDVYNLLVSRQIVVFSKDYGVQSLIKSMAFSGELIDYSGNYFYVAESNRNASKTGAFINRSVDRKIRLRDSGKVEVTTKLTRTHTASEYLHYYFDPEFNGYKYLVASDNVEIKVAIPKGSVVIGSSMTLNKVGIENNYDIYSFNSNIEPATTVSYEINYVLPTQIAMEQIISYNSYFQLPVGTHPFNIRECIESPKDYTLVASSKSSMSINDGSVCYDVNTSQDSFLSLIYAKN